MADRIDTTPTVRAAEGRAPASAGGEAPLGDLFRQLAQDSATLVRQEVALAKAEIRENVKTVARNATMIAVGGVLALLGLLVLVAFLVIALGDALWNEYWLGALIVGALFLIIGGIMAKKALGNLKQESLAPEQTIATLKEDKQWLQSEMSSVRRDLA